MSAERELGLRAENEQLRAMVARSCRICGGSGIASVSGGTGSAKHTFILCDHGSGNDGDGGDYFASGLWPMKLTELPYLTRKTSRGKVYWYFRRAGAYVALPDPTAPDFLARYEAVPRLAIYGRG